MKKCFALLIALFLFAVTPAFAAYDCSNPAACTITCDGTGDAADFSSAFAGVSAGGTITVGNGTCEIESEVVYTTTKSFTLQGGGIGNTIISDLTGTAASALVLTINSNAAVTISGFTFDQNNVNKSGVDAPLVISGVSTNVRITACHFADLGDRGLVINKAGTTLFGVVDNCTFTKTSGTTQGISMFGDTTYPNGGVGAWGASFTTSPFGTANAFFIEDTTFDWGTPGDTVFDAYAGARYVFRFNTVEEAVMGHHGTDSGSYIGTNSWEIYQNTLAAGTATPARMFHSRGGSGYVWGNTATGTFSSPLDISIYRSTASYPTWGRCDGSSPFDGNTADNGHGTSGTATGGGATSMVHTGAGWGTNAWAGYYVHNTSEGTASNAQCKALISSNTSDTLTLSASLGSSCSGNSTFANGETYIITDGYPCAEQNGVTTDTDANGIENYNPLYEWLNTDDGAYITWNVVNGASYMVNNVDRYSYVSAGFNGTVGVGSGLVAAKPATCTTGVAYWATDEGTWDNAHAGNDGRLYKCTSTDTWEVAYTPYTYPHPLRQVAPDITTPVISNASPSGAQPCNPSPTANVTLSITCSDAVGCTACKACLEAAGCTVATDIDDAAMDITLTQSGTTWSVTNSGQTCGTASRNYFVKCEDAANWETAATTISYSINAWVPTGGSWGKSVHVGGKKMRVGNKELQVQ